MVKLALLVLTIALFAATLAVCSVSKGGKSPSPDLIKAYKSTRDRNPVMTHTFGADPCALVYDGRVYIYMTADTPTYEADGSVKTNTYGNINTLRVISSADLVNWTYHEPVKVAGGQGAAKWASCSWAPAAAHRTIDGKDYFFLYFSNSGNGVGVLKGESPLGPWTDPLGRALVNRQTPNCSDIPWVFDPAVFIDDDGKAYLYFGGGIPEGKQADPGTARVVELGSDMISLAGDPLKVDAPFFFEDSGVNKIDGRYIFSYCTNWNVTDTAKRELRIENAVIAVMSSNNPLGPFTMEGTVFRNPGTFFGVWGNNHHAFFEFKGQWYLAYHSQILEEAMGFPGKGYRVTHIDAVKINDGKIEPVTGTRRGVQQIESLDPFTLHSGSESGITAGLSFGSLQMIGSPLPYEFAEVREDGSWFGVYGADFGAGAKSAVISIRLRKKSGNCYIDIRLGAPDGELAGTFNVPVKTDGGISTFAEHTAKLSKTISGVQDVYFVFNSSDFDFGGWQFFR